jgi:predicted DNA-binding antitoxin AbrB/MazE fold protein
MIRTMQPVEACYEAGALRPRRPLALMPGEWVRLIVVRRPDPRRWNLQRLAQVDSESASLTEQGLDAWVESLDNEDRS